LIYLRYKSEKDPLTDYYFKVKEGIEPPQIIISIPLYYPFDHENGLTLMILNISSDIINPGLAAIYDSSKENRDEINKLSIFGYSSLEIILPILGVNQFRINDFLSGASCINGY
jgi:hypothetical protein